MEITKILPHTDEWYQIRVGKITSSKIGRIMGTPAKRRTYLNEVLAELLTGQAIVVPETNAMLYGASLEGEALYEIENRLNITANTSYFYQYGEYSGGTPDGENEDTAFEVKCPFNQSYHVGHLTCKTQEDLKTWEPDYYWQLKFNMLFSGRNKGIFASYDPRFRKSMQLHIIYFSLDETEREVMIKKLEEAEKIVKEDYERIKNAYL
jgi:hypothetical protein